MTTGTAILNADEVLTTAGVVAARGRLDGVVHRTPLDVSTTFAEMVGAARVDL